MRRHPYIMGLIGYLIAGSGIGALAQTGAPPIMIALGGAFFGVVWLIATSLILFGRPPL